MRVVQAEVSPGARERKENESMRERVSWERDGYGLEGVGGERGRQNLNINSPVNFRVGSSSGQTVWMVCGKVSMSHGLSTSRPVLDLYSV